VIFVAFKIAVVIGGVGLIACTFVPLTILLLTGDWRAPTGEVRDGRLATGVHEENPRVGNSTGRQYLADVRDGQVLQVQQR
jgi:hypothetical protein